MKIQDFSGGLSTRLSPQFIQLNQAVELNNADVTSGTLKSLHAHINTALELDQYMFYFAEEEKWLSFNIPTACLEYQGAVYTVNGSAPKIIKNDVTYNLGIAKPVTAPSLAPNPGSGGLDGTYTYVITFYNSTLGIESGPSPVSAEQPVTSPASINLTSIPVSTDPQVDKKFIYRIGGDLTSYTRVIDIANATTSYTDSIADNAVEGTILATSINEPAPTTLEHIAEYNGMLFGVEGVNLHFTPVGIPHSWPSSYVIRYPHKTIGTAKAANGLLVFTSKQVHVVTGTDYTNITSRVLDTRQGCVSWQSIQEFGQIVIWASNNGFCISSGGNTEVVSLGVLGEFQPNIVSSAVLNKVYYALDTSGLLYIFDNRFSPIFRTADVDVSTLATDNNNLFGWFAGAVLQLFSDPNTLLTFTYTSPRFIEGSATELKSYKKIYVFSEGSIIINVLIEDQVVVSKQLTTKGLNEFQLPAEKQRGCYIQFVIEGTGEVLELEYKVGS